MEELKNKLLQDCNESGLPLEAIYYLVKDLFRDVSDTYENILKLIESTSLLLYNKLGFDLQKEIEIIE